jgi:hypothetical protein
MYFRKTEKQELTIAEHKYAENIAEYEGRRFLFKDGFSCHCDFRHFYQGLLLSRYPFSGRIVRSIFWASAGLYPLIPSTSSSSQPEYSSSSSSS